MMSGFASLIPRPGLPVHFSQQGGSIWFPDESNDDDRRQDRAAASGDQVRCPILFQNKES